MPRARLDVEGLRFGRLQVLTWESGLWACVCDCGGLALTEASRLVRGCTKSCGCLRDEGLSQRARRHGAALQMTPEYRSWLNMRRRCLSPGSRHYDRYGGRGIGICKRWGSFLNFLEDMGPRPQGTTLDRRNNSEGYAKRNCRWATREAQSNNRDCSVMRKAFGESKSLAQWARDPRCSVGYRALCRRVKAGWTLINAMDWAAKRWPRHSTKEKT